MVSVRRVFTDRSHGDLAVTGDLAALEPRRRAIGPGPWTWLHQVHGAEVVVVDRPGARAGVEADAAVTVAPGAVLAVQTADCAPVLLVGGPDTTGIAVVHAGWRGLEAGVIEAAAATMAQLGAPVRRAELGPCIRAGCYPFGEEDLDRVAGRYGDGVRGVTASGAPALDVAAGVAEACRRLGVDLVDDGTCTACSPRHWSHRARGERARQALVAWLEP